MSNKPVIAVLGASGLIGHELACGLLRAGFDVVALARRFTPAQKSVLGAAALETPIVDLDAAALTELLRAHDVDLVVNAIGVLQDGAGGTTGDVHAGFAARLLAALQAQDKPALLVQVSIPGADAYDTTPFARTKREAEHMIKSSGVPYVILRPGFVVAPAAYGGSALIRALAALPFSLPAAEGARVFAAVDVNDISRSVEWLAARWAEGRRDFAESWDVMERAPRNVSGVVAAFGARFGGPAARFALPDWLMSLGAKLGDLSMHLGWTPPIRTTALAELRRGVSGDPRAWIAATGLEPTSLQEMLALLPATVQERWFARLFLLKAGVIGWLALFWIVSGLIALLPAFSAAKAILTTHGFSPEMAGILTVLTSLADIAIGFGIAFRRTCRKALWAGILLSAGYLASSVFVTPELWLDPVGSLVKTPSSLVLMLVAVGILEDR